MVGFYGISTIVVYLIPNPLFTYIKYIWFCLVGFYGISTIGGYVMPKPLYTYILNSHDLDCFGFMVYEGRLFNAKHSLYIWFSLVRSYGISTIVCYLMPNPLYTYIRYIWFCLVGFYGIYTIVGYLMPNPPYTYILDTNIKHCRPFNPKSYLYIYIKYIRFGLFRGFAIPTLVGYLMINSLYMYIEYIICKNVLLTFWRAWGFCWIQLNGFKYI